MFELPKEIPAKLFLQKYWQKQPLLMRKAAKLHPIPSKERLFSLSTEDEVESRIVLENGFEGPWEAHHGPFDPDAIVQLPGSGWTLLIQDADKHLPSIAPLLDDFSFIPSWRIDDIMISYAADRGSVGPHTDEYDVFLLQASGKRRWKIHQKPVRNDDLFPDLDLKILRRFEAEEEWLLEPGDVLYLPPGVAHWGIAEGECTTWSVGFRAPSVDELMFSWLEERTYNHPSGHYRDHGNLIQEHHGEISRGSLNNINSLLTHAMAIDDEELSIWFGKYLTEPKENLMVPRRENRMNPEEVTGRLAENALIKHPWSKLLFIRSDDKINLFAGGKAYGFPHSSLALVDKLCGQSRLGTHELKAWLDCTGCTEGICALINDGHLNFGDE